MKTRTTETQFNGPITWRIVAAAPILVIAAPFWLAGNGLAMIASCVAGKNIAYSWETDVESIPKADPAAVVGGSASSASLGRHDQPEQKP